MIVGIRRVQRAIWAKYEEKEEFAGDRGSFPPNHEECLKFLDECPQTTRTTGWFRRELIRGSCLVAALLAVVPSRSAGGSGFGRGDRLEVVRGRRRGGARVGVVTGQMRVHTHGVSRNMATVALPAGVPATRSELQHTAHGHQGHQSEHGFLPFRFRPSARTPRSRPASHYGGRLTRTTLIPHSFRQTLSPCMIHFSRMIGSS